MLRTSEAIPFPINRFYLIYRRSSKANCLECAKDLAVNNHLIFFAYFAIFNFY